MFSNLLLQDYPHTNPPARLSSQHSTCKTIRITFRLQDYPHNIPFARLSSQHSICKTVLTPFRLQDCPHTIPCSDETKTVHLQECSYNTLFCVVILLPLNFKEQDSTATLPYPSRSCQAQNTAPRSRCSYSSRTQNRQLQDNPCNPTSRPVQPQLDQTHTRTSNNVHRNFNPRTPRPHSRGGVIMSASTVVLYRGPSTIDGNPVIALMSGLERPSTNAKTGPVLQTWIIPDIDDPPHVAVRAGRDRSVCGGCPLRGKGGCYVRTHQATRALWEKRDQPPHIKDADRLRIRGRALRIGAYGDPTAVPIDVWLDLLRACGPSKHTGFTHRWCAPSVDADPRWRSFLMASTETIAGLVDATDRGWRPFHVVAKGAGVPGGLVQCASGLERPLRCIDCGLCGGARKARTPGVWINAHGSTAQNTQG